MLQNKIYQNFYLEISKTFLVILFGLSIIALTVRAVNFLDLIVDSGYPLTTYFSYSFLNLFGVALKFIPLSFLLALIIFILTNSLIWLYRLAHASAFQRFYRIVSCLRKFIPVKKQWIAGPTSDG